MGSLSNLYISQSYTSLAHLGTNNALVVGQMTQLQDGLGTSLNINFDGTNISSSGNIYAANLTGSGASINTGSFVTTSSFNSYTSSTNGRLTSIETTTASLNNSVSALNTNSASVNISISNLNNVTSSLFTSASLALVTASFDNNTRNLTFTKGNTTQFSVNIPDVSGSTINTGSLVTTASFNSYTQSTNIRLDNLESTSASVNVSISNLNSTTSSFATSISNLNTTTASLNTSITNLNASSASQQVSIDALNVFTASQSTASIVTSINNLNTFSASALVSISNLNSTTASLNTSVTNLNAFTQSANQRIGSLEAATSSYANSASVAIVDATQNQRLDSLESFTASLDLTYVTQSELAAATGALEVSINTKLNTSSFNAYTQSNDEKVNSLISATGSYAISASVAAVDAAQQQSINSINAVTSSFLTSSADISLLNSFTASQLIINSGYNTFTSSANQRLDSLETNSASVNISISSLNTFTASQSTASLVTSITELNTFSASAKVSISALNTNSASVNTSISNLNSFTQSQESVNTILAGEIDSLQAKTGSYATTGSNNFVGDQIITGNISALSASFTYLQTIYESSSIIYSSGSNQFGDELSDVQTLSGSVRVQGSLTVNGTPVLTSSVDISGLVTTSSFNAYTQSNDQRVTSLEVNSASVNTSITNINSTTASLLIETNNLELFSASALISIANLNTNTASQQISIDNLNQKTGSYATTGSNVFTGSQTFADSGSNSMTLHSISGSLGYTNSNIDGFFNVSASFVTANPNARLGGNLLFKNAPNATGSLVISGSGNLVMAMPGVNPGFRAQLTANNLAYVLPQISASMQNGVTIQGNIIQSGVSLRGPVTGSGGYSITGNYIAGGVTLGTSAANHFQRAIGGVNISTNIINGNISAIANTTDLNTAFSIANSNINAGLTINAISSSVQIGSSTFSGTGLTINNRASHSIAPGTNNFLILSSVLHSGQTTVINADGASTTNVSPGLVGSFLGGTATTIQLGTPAVASDSNQLRNTIVFGQNLNVTGSNSAAAAATQGGAFLGRWNSTTPRQNDSSYVVFAVGTGTSAGTRKTGFLIDSGSNTFVEGSLNVSGSLLLNGSTISAINTGSFATTGSNSFVGTQRITGSLIVSGSGAEVRFPSFDATAGRVKETLAFTGSRFASNLSMSIEMENLNTYQFGFNQNALGDSNTGAQFTAETNKDSGFTQLVLNARYSGSNNAEFRIRNAAGVRTATIDADITTLNGGLYITSGSWIPSATGSSILTWNSATGQVAQSSVATLISSSFSVGAFNSTITQSGSAAVSQSMTFNNTDISNGITLNGGGTQLTIANNGTYNIQFSAQILAGTGADTIWIWLKKNGTNVSNTATKLVLRNNEADVAAWNFVVPAVPTDYFELVWQSLDGHATLLTEAASGNYPAIPSVIVTVTQVE
jgi:uncharacterized coiled-coil protein SlyX